MPYLLKLLLSAGMILLIAEISKKYPGLGGLIASLPLLSVLGMTWLWLDTRDAELLASHSLATFWFVLPSLPMFVVLPLLLRRGLPFFLCLFLSCLLTIGLYLLMMLALKRFGVAL
ncbi:hypothetical protein COW36_18280 [bacterium (Candidatus Blackallbacteria) CG17_big_fil_post_rev_8_21_14_2_50_48_46]|uniref:DUF3147 domain-containing protein n=1 Tax=bacterium (Candidatus Blackallbacteria) CG17_big_fil_post_rev_8_21_14_2_50_48_46 TaxID=2014261 RepID=A0A2M7G0Y3_9BACT|nr:MAG: hypothetical protein COW64_00455 [bacterium (Candidatus Blackallbacteria) CG18_big_fil_WC_8_21_14_2_50_49_26]PIW15364.1 MAG: hypothetical protein COW36_18280 [bacterium (Candidatus Blackallbacteria) CG17_big_fil_post_rev_8_21_14_2_50_48_46]PIW49775.1 MAG: hypothetical protein COW20_05085 [bacterium (Candidatus Blackallbacteria) CG13_big_fil_rev_8_21_14_2_50_49_14]